MNFEEFKTNALRTENTPKELNFSASGLLLLLEAAVSMAKVVDQAKKTMIYSKPFDDVAFSRMIDTTIDQLRTVQGRVHALATPTVTEGITEPNPRITHGAIGMFGEAGELLEAIVKSMRKGGELDLVNIAEETGDSDWYKALIHDETGVDEDTTRGKVIAKLVARYGDKFSSEAALNRDLAAERAVLEGSN